MSCCAGMKEKSRRLLTCQRKAIFDIYCENERGEKFIVEMQKAKQNYFKDRSIYYSTFPIRSQAQQGVWDFDLKSVYTVGILDFVFDEDKASDQVFHHEVQLFDKSVQAVFYDKLIYIYLEMPKFTKMIDELETHFDNWLYVLKNLENLTDRPAQLQESIFTKLFEQAEIANFDDEEYSEYERSLKTYRDLKNSFDTAREEGREKGRREGREEGRREGGKEEKITILKVNAPCPAWGCMDECRTSTDSGRHRRRPRGSPKSGQKESRRLFYGHGQRTLTSESRQPIRHEDLLGQPVTVRLELPDDQDRYLNGIISRFAHTGFDGDLTCYQATLVPWLWLLTRTTDCRRRSHLPL